MIFDLRLSFYDSQIGGEACYSACILRGTKSGRQKFCAERRILRRTRIFAEFWDLHHLSPQNSARPHKPDRAMARTGADLRRPRAVTPLVVWKEGRQHNQTCIYQCG